jgi:ABC-2 type transport system permease protein
MHNVWLIARREYVERIRTRGFIVTTVLIPLILAGFILGSTFLGSKATSNVRVAIVSSDTQLALDLQGELERRQPAETATSKRPHISADAMGIGPDTRSIVNEEIESGDLDGYLWIAPPTTPGARPIFSYSARSAEQVSVPAALADALSTVLMREQLAHRGIVSSDANAMLQPVSVETAQAPHHADSEAAEISVTILFFLMYMVIMLYGMNVARSIIEEKTSRVFEVMLASTRPEEMMAGKIIGVGSVGLTQAGIWLSAGLLLASSSIAANLDGQRIQVALTAPQVVYFLLYFMLGYLFYSAIAAALGAMTNSEQELQHLNLFLVLPLAFCFITLKSVLTNPDSTLSRALAMMPPFTPLLMYVRVCLGHPARWEIALSILLTSASIYGIIWVTSRIYRVGVLMYGKRPTLPEIARWLKYS